MFAPLMYVGLLNIENDMSQETNKIQMKEEKNIYWPAFMLNLAWKVVSIPVSRSLH